MTTNPSNPFLRPPTSPPITTSEYAEQVRKGQVPVSDVPPIATPSNVGEVPAYPGADGSPVVVGEGDKPKSPASDESLAELVEKARGLKKVADDIAAEREALRAQIWEASGHQIGKLPGGASFRAPTARRSVNYKALERDYPEVYADVVTVNEPEPGKMGSLYL